MTIKNLFVVILLGSIVSACNKDDDSTPIQPDLTFEKTYGGALDDQAEDILIVGESIYLYGTTRSKGDPNGDHFLVKTDIEGNQLFEKSYNGDGIEDARKMVLTSDGHILLLGVTRTGVGAQKDLHLIKVNLNGDLIWQKKYGGDLNELAAHIIETSQGEICIAATTASFGVEASDIYIIWLDQNGNVLREKTYGGGGTDGSAEILEIENEALVLFGYTDSFGATSRDLYLMKISGQGDSLWAKTYGGDDYEESHDIERTASGGFLLTGHTASTEPNHNMYAIKTDIDGEVIWDKQFGGALHDGAQSAVIDPNGNYAFVGQSVSFSDGDIDIYFVVTTPDGNIISDEVIGGGNEDFGAEIAIYGSQYFIAGRSNTISQLDLDFYMVSRDIQ